MINNVPVIQKKHITDTRNSINESVILRNEISGTWNSKIAPDILSGSKGSPESGHPFKFSKLMALHDA